MSDYWSSPDPSYGSNADGESDQPQFDEDDLPEFSDLMKRDVLLMLVDCGPKMQLPNSDGQTWLARALEAVTQSLKNKIISSPYDSVGVAFFNTRQSKNDAACDGYYVLFPPEEPRAELIKRLHDLQEKKTFEAEIGFGRADKPCEMFQVLWASASVFSGAQQVRNAAKRLLIFTCEDNPCRGNKALAEKAEKKAKDLADVGVAIQVLPLVLSEIHPDRKPVIGGPAASSLLSSLSSSSAASSSSSASSSSGSSWGSQQLQLQPGSLNSSGSSWHASSADSSFPGSVGPRSASKLGFNLMTFYAGIAEIDQEDGADAAEMRIVESLSDLMDLLKSRLITKRALTTMVWTLGEGSKVGVKVYCMVRESKPDYPRRLDSADSTPLATKVRWICPTGSALQDFQMKKYYQYSTAKVIFTDDEMQKIRSFGDAGLTLLGFKPASALMPHHNIKNPYFIYPDDFGYPGSLTAFVALYNAMTRQRKVAICRMVTRRHSIPRLVALIPSEERVGVTSTGRPGGQIQPPGMTVVFLPYAEDLRSPEIRNPNVVADEPLVRRARKVVAAMTIPRPPGTVFDSEMWRGQVYNPVLQHHYGIVEAYALDQQVPDIPDSTLVPSSVVAKAKPELDEFVAEVDKEASVLIAAAAAAGVAPAKKAAGSRKKADDGTGGAGAAAAAGPVDYSTWKAPAIADHLDGKTIPELKDYCRHFGLPLSGKKQDFVDRVFTHLKKQ